MQRQGAQPAAAPPALLGTAGPAGEGTKPEGERDQDEGDGGEAGTGETSPQPAIGFQLLAAKAAIADSEAQGQRQIEAQGQGEHGAMRIETRVHQQLNSSTNPLSALISRPIPLIHQLLPAPLSHDLTRLCGEKIA